MTEDEIKNTPVKRPKGILAIMKAATVVTFKRCDGEYLWYELCGTVTGPRSQFEPGEPPHYVDEEWWYIATYNDVLMDFRIPLKDTLGGNFPDRDTNCMYYMRWIREELELAKETVKMIEQAKKEWKP